MINKPPPFKHFNIRIHSIAPIKGRGVNQESGLGIRVQGLGRCLFRLGLRVWSLGFEIAKGLGFGGPCYSNVFPKPII